MIFSRFRTPKHQDPNAEVRLACIDNLDPDNHEHKRILHELAFNDADAGVSLKALSRLDSFALWSKMAEIASDERVQKRARQQVEFNLFDAQSALDVQQKLVFLRECRQNSLLEKALTQDWLLNEHVDDALYLLEQLNKPHFTRKILLSDGAQALQRILVEREDDQATLQKLVRKSPNPQVVATAQSKLDAAAASVARIAELEKSLTLTLSQLRALKEVDDFDTFTQQRTSLEEQYANAVNELREKGALNGLGKEPDHERKYSQISEVLDQYQQAQLSEWQAKQRISQQLLRVERLNKTLNDANLHFDQVLRKVTEGEAPIDASTPAQQSTYGKLQIELLECTRLPDLPDQIRAELESALQQVQQKLTTLTTLPQALGHIQVARSAVIALQQVTLPDSDDSAQYEAALQTLEQLRQQFYQARDAVDAIWPTALDSQWQGPWQALKKQQKEAQKAVFEKADKCRAKLRVVDNLVKQGKFNAAMALFSRVSKWFDGLPQRQQNQLQRAFDKTSEQVASLKGWQAYIAAPRKPELLEQARGLAEETDQFDERAREVKHLRSAWHSLGHLDTEEDHELNNAFEQALETAFEPCRQHFAAEQAQRAANLEQKRALIGELRALAESQPEAAELARSLNKLKQRWRAIGHVDYEAVDAVQNDYKQVVQPLEQSVAGFYQDNAEQKQRLLIQAEALLDHDTVFEAAEQAKALQQRWKSIGHAGQKTEGQLWSAFRRVNDEIFSRLKAQRQASRDEEQVATSELHSALQSMSDKVNGVELQKELDACKVELKDIDQAIAALHDGARYKLGKQAYAVGQAIERREKALVQSRKDNQIRAVFDVVRDWRGADLPAGHASLPKSWQQAFRKTEANQRSRHAITLRMEIVAGLESPAAEKSLRNEIQLSMMADKLQAGEQDNLDALLRDWIGQGPLTEQDIELLDRVNCVYSR